MCEKMGEQRDKKTGRRTKEITIYNYPEHLNPFYEDDQHRRLRFWKINKNGIAERNNNSFTNGLKSICARFSNQNRKSSSLGVYRTSESPPETPTQKRSPTSDIKEKLDNSEHISQQSGLSSRLSNKAGSNATEYTSQCRKSRLLSTSDLLENSSKFQSQNVKLPALSNHNATKFPFETPKRMSKFSNSKRNMNSNSTEIKMDNMYTNYNKRLPKMNSSNYRTCLGSSLENLQITVQNNLEIDKYQCQCKFCGNVWIPRRNKCIADFYQISKPQPKRRHIIRSPISLNHFELNDSLNEKMYLEKLATPRSRLTCPSTPEQAPIADYSLNYDSVFEINNSSDIGTRNYAKNIEYYQNASMSSEPCSYPALNNFHNKLSTSTVEHTFNEVPKAYICNDHKIENDDFMECIHIHVFKKQNRIPEENNNHMCKLTLSAKTPRKRLRTEIRNSPVGISSSSSVKNIIESEDKHKLELTRENLLRNVSSISKDILLDYLSHGPFDPPFELDFNDLEDEVEHVASEESFFSQSSCNSGRSRTNMNEKKREDKKENLEVGVIEPLIDIDLEKYKFRLNNLKEAKSTKTTPRHVCLRSGLTSEEFKSKLFEKSVSRLEWKQSSLAPLPSKIPTEKRRSFTEIIDSINKSQTMLKEAGNKKDSLALSKQVY